MAVADPQLIDMRHRRPAATGDDLVVGRDRLLGELFGRWRQHRRRRLRHVDGARGLVEILAELAGTAVVHQRVERVVGEGAARNTAQCRRAGALRKKSATVNALTSLSHGAVPWRVDLACHRHAAKGSSSSAASTLHALDCVRAGSRSFTAGTLTSIFMGDRRSIDDSTPTTRSCCCPSASGRRPRRSSPIHGRYVHRSDVTAHRQHPRRTRIRE